MDISWTVVQFLEDKTIEAIPTSWIRGESCHWPPYHHAKLTNSIKKCEAINLSWPRHSIKVFRNASYPNYLLARNKVRKLEDVGNSEGLSTDDNGRRKIKKKVFSIPTSSEEEEEDPNFGLPPPPTVPIISQNTNVSLERDLPHHSEIDVDRDGNILHTIIMGKTKSNTPVPPLPADNIRTTSPRIIPSCCCDHGSMLIELKNQQHLLRGMVMELLVKIDKLENVEKRTSQENETTSFFVKYPNLSFPLEVNDQILEFDDILRDEKNFNDALNEIKKFGGASVFDFIKRSLSSIVKDELLIKYSFYGRKGKLPFNKLILSKLLIRAADIAITGNNNKQTELAIQKFLRRCQERLNAKENRKKITL